MKKEYFDKALEALRKEGYEIEATSSFCVVKIYDKGKYCFELGTTAYGQFYLCSTDDLQCMHFETIEKLLEIVYFVWHCKNRG